MPTVTEMAVSQIGGDGIRLVPAVLRSKLKLCWDCYKGRNSLKPRERLETTLNLQEPDRVPIDLGSIVTGITSGANEALTHYLGIESDDTIVDRIQQLVRPTETLLDRLQVDTRYVYISASRDWKDIELPDHTYEDEFGVRRKAAFTPEGRLLYYDFTGKPPLADAETPADIAKFKWPDPHDPARYAGLEERVKKVYEETDYGVIVNAIASIFEFSWYLRGFMAFYMDLAANPPMIEALLSAMREFQIAMFEEILIVLDRMFQSSSRVQTLALSARPAYPPKPTRNSFGLIISSYGI